MSRFKLEFKLKNEKINSKQKFFFKNNVIEYLRQYYHSPNMVLDFEVSRDTLKRLKQLHHIIALYRKKTVYSEFRNFESYLVISHIYSRLLTYEKYKNIEGGT